MTQKKRFSEKERKGVIEDMKTREEMRVTPEELRGTVDYISEINGLRRIPRRGQRHGGPPLKVEQDDDAGHAAITAQIAFILGKMEGMTTAEALILAGKTVFHENWDTRVPEMDKVDTHYLVIPRETLEAVMRDQTSRLPKEIGEEIRKFPFELEFGEGLEAEVFHDADALEPAVHTKIAHERGYTLDENLLKGYLDEERVRKEWAKRLMSTLRRRRSLSTRWWEDLMPKLG